MPPDLMSNPRTWLAIAILLAIAGIRRMIKPMRKPKVDCRLCRGAGRLREGRRGKYSGDCPRCGTEGRHTRLAAKVAGVVVPWYSAPD